jgi:phosphatidylinositol alpha-1,6-mannosyltransferase
MSEAGKVLLIANNFPPIRGGSAVVYDNLARFSGGRLIPIAPQRSYLDGSPLTGWQEHDSKASYRVLRLPLLRNVLWSGGKVPPLRRPALLFADLVIRARLAMVLLRQILGGGVAAICVGELVASGWIVRLFGLIPGLRIFIYVHGEEITTETPYDSGGARRRGTLLAADGIVVVSRFTLEAVRRMLGPMAGNKIRLIENGVDTSRFRPRGKSRDLLDTYRLDGGFVFVSVCRLLEKKGLDHAIRAFATVCATCPDCRYLIVGGGPFRERLEAIAAEVGVAGKVRFVGEVSDERLSEFYCLGDVFVMPNRRMPDGDTEGFGLVFLEANSCGLPVIAGRDGGSTDAVQHGVNGLVVDGASVDDIARAMLMLREDEALRADLARGGLARARQADWAGKAEDFLRLCLGERDPAEGPEAGERQPTA